MPTYQYACTDCGHRFDAVQSFSDDALTECPECGGRLRKVYGAVGVVFKGSGFYRNDSRGSAPSESKDSSDSGSSSSETKSGSEKKTDTTSTSSSDSSKSASTTQSKPAPKSESTAASSSKAT